MTPWTDDDRREYERLVKSLKKPRQFVWAHNEAWKALEQLKNRHQGTMPPKPPSTPENALNVP